MFFIVICVHTYYLYIYIYYNFKQPKNPLFYQLIYYEVYTMNQILYFSSTAINYDPNPLGY